MAALAKIAASGEKVAFVVAEEGFHDTEGSGRDDLASRMAKIGMAVTGKDESSFRADVLDVPGAAFGSGSDLDVRARSGEIRPGSLAAYVFRFEDEGERMKR